MMARPSHHLYFTSDDGQALLSLKAQVGYIVQNQYIPRYCRKNHVSGPKTYEKQAAIYDAFFFPHRSRIVLSIRQFTGHALKARNNSFRGPVNRPRYHKWRQHGRGRGKAQPSCKLARV